MEAGATMASRSPDTGRAATPFPAVEALPARRFRLMVGGIMLAIALALATLSIADPAGYVTVMRLLSVEVVQRGFIDWRYVADTVRCWQDGQDVWHGNACDLLARPMDYSPLLLRMGFLATGPVATVMVAIGVVVAFAAALIALPVPRVGWGQLVLALSVLSPATAFIVERGNIDALIVAMLVAAALAASHSRGGRWLAHGLITAAASIKFYPAAGLALIVRERRWDRIAAIVALYALMIGGFGWWFRAELALTLANVPQGTFFSNGMFGAAILPRAAAVVVQQIADPAIGPATLADDYRRLATLLLVACTLVAIGIAVTLVWRQPPPSPTLADSREGVVFLLVGSVLAGCFFAGLNIHYRATMAIPLLPLLIALADGEDRVIARAARTATMIIPLLLWIPAVELVLARPTTTLGGIDTAVWLVRELLWWAAMARIVAILAWLALPLLRSTALSIRRPSVSG